MKRNLVIITIICATFFSCQDSNPQETIPERKPVNYIVLLDLSDRLIDQGQAERDIELVKAVFDMFDQAVRRNLVINSRDKFQVLIAPQKGIPYNCSEFEDALFIDMGGMNAGIKKNTLVEFRMNLTPVLTELYRKARIGSRTSDYPGTGLWQFFNESLGFHAGNGYENKLVLLTDGYFDLEDYSRQLSSDNRYPTTSFLANIRGKNDWKTILEKEDLGLLPINKQFSGVEVLVAEVNPKYDFQYESDMLVFVWKKWCHEMKIPVTEVLLKTSLPQTITLLKDKLTIRS
jgi:hypothetical protein